MKGRGKLCEHIELQFGQCRGEYSYIWTQERGMRRVCMPVLTTLQVWQAF